MPGHGRGRGRAEASTMRSSLPPPVSQAPNLGLPRVPPVTRPALRSGANVRKERIRWDGRTVAARGARPPTAVAARSSPVRRRFLRAQFVTARWRLIYI